MTTTEDRKRVQRDGLCRSVTFTRDDEHGDGRTFKGYGAVFNSPTRIDSWEGRFDEQFAPGSFRKTLRDKTPKFQFDHGRHPLIGSVPIGVITEISEDEQGLDVEARLGRHLFIDFIQEALETGAITGMSIRFSVVREEWRDATGQVVAADDVEELLWQGRRSDGEPLMRTILEAKLDEVGPVVWPAYEDTTAGVRSDPVTIDPARLNEPEQRRLLAELLLRSEQAAREGDSSDAAPQDTPDGAVEHSEDDTTAPQDTPDGAVEHSEETPENPGESGTQARAEADELLYAHALAEVRAIRESTPNMEGI